MSDKKGKVFYGLHFLPGVAEYREPGKEMFRIFINEDTIRSMNPTFAGRPVYVNHVNDVDISDKNSVDGWVVESFFNQSDGKTWCKFIVVSEEGERAIKLGYKLSNAYLPKGFSAGGKWNGVEFDREIVSGEFEHLAIVSDPRYAESVILTPEQFKNYCDEKKTELTRIANSKEKPSMSILKLWNRKPVENSADLEHMSVTLPKCGKEYTLIALVNAMDKIENMNGYANGDHMVKVGDKEMSVNELADCYGKMVAKNAEDEEKAKNSAEEEKKKENKEELDLAEKKNSEEEEEKKENADIEAKQDGDKEDKMVKKNSFEALKNAERAAFMKRDVVRADIDKAARGKQRYGSN
jgi:hypothetical protein